MHKKAFARLCLFSLLIGFAGAGLGLTGCVMDPDGTDPPPEQPLDRDDDGVADAFDVKTIMINTAPSVAAAIPDTTVLVNSPAIVWADEPTGDLDSETAGEIIDLMCELNRANGQTFVLVSHSLEVGQRAHRIVRMRDGEIEDDGNGSASPGKPGDGADSPQEARE